MRLHFLTEIYGPSLSQTFYTLFEMIVRISCADLVATSRDFFKCKQFALLLQVLLVYFCIFSFFIFFAWKHFFPKYFWPSFHQMSQFIFHFVVKLSK